MHPVRLALAAMLLPAAFDPEASTLVARPGEPLAGVADEDWSRHLPDLLPAIGVCLEAVPGAFVAAAWPGKDGARVRLALPGGARRDCQVARATGASGANGAPGTEATTFRDVPDSDRSPDERFTAFSRERGCVDARRVENPDGRVLGWLGYPGCF